jgi:hypothetical protein
MFRAASPGCRVFHLIGFSVRQGGKPAVSNCGFSARDGDAGVVIGRAWILQRI